MDGAPDVEGAVASAVKKAIISQVSSNDRIKFIIIWQLSISIFHTFNRIHEYIWGFINCSMSKPTSLKTLCQ